MSHRTGANGPKPFLTARWGDLAMVTWEAEPALLRPWLPPGINLDLRPPLSDAAEKPVALLSLVAFRFDEVRVLGFKVPGHGAFDEVNVRFYARRVLPSGEELKGVVFFSELVPKPLAALAARVLYGEPYVTRSVHHVVSTRRRPGRPPARVARYRWMPVAVPVSGQRDSWGSVSLEAEGSPRVPAPDSDAAFLVDRTHGWTRRGARTSQYEVRHPRWRCWEAPSAARPETERALLSAGCPPEVASALAGKPPRRFLLAAGSVVEVGRPERLPPDS